MRARFSFALLVAAACENGAAGGTLNVELVDPAGENAAYGRGGTLTIEVRQNDRLLACEDGACVSTINDGDFDLAFPIASGEAMTWAHATIEDDAGMLLIGASPPFQPYGESIDALGLVRVVMAPPSSCHVLTIEGAVHRRTPHLTPPRGHSAAVLRRNIVLFVGGDAGSAIDRVDLLTNDVDPLPHWTEEQSQRLEDGRPPAEIGRARGVAISEDVSLVVGDSGAWAFVRNDSFLGARPEELGVHANADSTSALIELGDGAAVIGGATTTTITWVDENGNAGPFTSLALERTRPAAARVGDGILVVGGQARGAAAVERVQVLGGGRAVIPNGAEVEVARLDGASGGVLLPSPDGADALYVAFDVGGAPSGSTVILNDCSRENCEVLPGPDWPRPRADVATAITASGTLWLVGGLDNTGAVSDAIDLVFWDGSVARIVEGPSLVEPRAGASVIEHASGIVILGGGLGVDGMREDLEMCFPPELDPLL